ncbi:MAG: cytidine deaminase [Alistipes sp.]|nr:cytidine deaminase [Alistipes sp.]
MKKELNISYDHYESMEAMPIADQELTRAAIAATKGAYAPYSHFHVGAAARLKSGRIVSGANSESEVFPSGICAERSLLFFYQANYADDPIEALAIASDPSERECYPCGNCRQTIIDVERRQASPMRIIMWGGGTATAVDSAELLLPFTFKL